MSEIAEEQRPYDKPDKTLITPNNTTAAPVPCNLWTTQRYKRINYKILHRRSIVYSPEANQAKLQRRNIDSRERGCIFRRAEY